MGKISVFVLLIIGLIVGSMFGVLNIIQAASIPTPQTLTSPSLSTESNLVIDTLKPRLQWTSSLALVGNPIKINPDSFGVFVSSAWAQKSTPLPKWTIFQGDWNHYYTIDSADCVTIKNLVWEAYVDQHARA